MDYGVYLQGTISQLYIGGNTFRGMSSENIHGAGSYNTETVTGTVTLVTYGTSAINSSGGAVTATLPDGEAPGQIKTIVMSNATAPSTVSVTHHITSDPEVGAFDNTGDIWVLMWTGYDWATITATCTF